MARLAQFAKTLSGLLALACVCGCAGTSSHQDQRTDGFLVGIGTHLTSDRGLDMIHEAGVGWLRDDIRWSRVEPEKGRLEMPVRYEEYVNESIRRGIQPLLILCYGNSHYDGGGFPKSPEAREAFTRFAEFVVRHFKGRVRLYEIWNEWNIGIGMPPGVAGGDPTVYAGLLGGVYPRLKAIDPRITIIGGALAGTGEEDGWLETACSQGLLDNLDGLSFHPYCYGETDDGRLPEHGFMRRIQTVNSIVSRHAAKREVPIYITEIGWPNHTGGNGSSAVDSARFLARAFLLCRTMPAIKGLWWYDWRDDGPDPANKEHNFGIVTHELAPKPPYSAMRDISRLIRDISFPPELEVNGKIRVLRFLDAAGTGSARALVCRDGRACRSGGTSRESRNGEPAGLPLARREALEYCSQSAGAHPGQLDVCSSKRQAEEVLVLWSLTDETWQARLSATNRPLGEAELKPIGGEVTAVSWAERDGHWEIRLTLGSMPCIVRTGTLGVNVTASIRDID